MPKKATSKQISYFCDRDQVIKSLPIRNTDIIFAGDSEFQEFDAAEFFNDLRFKNRGICYDTSLGLVNRISDIIQGKPAKVFIEIGINDLNSDTEVSRIAENVKTIVSLIKTNSPETKVYLLSTLPFGLKEIQRKQLNGLYAQISDATFINLDQYFENNLSMYVSDHVHLNYRGYLQLIHAIKPFLN